MCFCVPPPHPPPQGKTGYINRLSSSLHFRFLLWYQSSFLALLSPFFLCIPFLPPPPRQSNHGVAPSSAAPPSQRASKSLGHIRVFPHVGTSQGALIDGITIPPSHRRSTCFPTPDFFCFFIGGGAKERSARKMIREREGEGGERRDNATQGNCRHGNSRGNPGQNTSLIKKLINCLWIAYLCVAAYSCFLIADLYLPPRSSLSSLSRGFDARQ